MNKNKQLFLLLLLCLSSKVYSATLWVTNNTSNKTLSHYYSSIQSAIDNALPKDTIQISAGHYFENIKIDKSLRLIGPTFNKKKSINSEPSVIIDGFYNGNVITITPGSKVSIENIRIMNGKSKNGGGINNAGSLMLNNSEVIYNLASESGGGIYNARSISGSLYISNCQISHNKSLGDDKYNVKFGGGGIYNNSPLMISNSIINKNYAEDNGGGIYSIYSGRKKPTHNEIIAETFGLSTAQKRENTLYRKTDIDAVSITKSQITNNIAGAGGGLNLQGVMNILDTSLVNNKAINHSRSAGGGIFAHLDTTLNINDTLLSQNKANFRGAGIRFYSTKIGRLNNVTLTDNVIIKNFGQGAGLFLQKYTKNFQIKNSVIARNTIMHKRGSDCYGKITSGGNNFIGYKYRCQWQLNTGDIIGELDHKKVQ